MGFIVGQEMISYGYDDDDRLITVGQGDATVRLGHDALNRRTAVAFPDGVIGTIGYDGANQLTHIEYSTTAVPLGDLAYTYDATGNPVTVAGSWRSLLRANRKQ